MLWGKKKEKIKLKEVEHTGDPRLAELNELAAQEEKWRRLGDKNQELIIKDAFWTRWREIQAEVGMLPILNPYTGIWDDFDNVQARHEAERQAGRKPKYI